jgi:two-component system, sensor histidine kinase
MKALTRSLRRRLIGLIVAGGVASAVIAAAGFTWLDLDRFGERAVHEVSALADILAGQTAPALMLSDRRAAEEVLGSLSADPRVRDAALYNAANACFAWLGRPAVDACPERSAIGTLRAPGYLRVTRPVEAGGERVGTLTIAVNLPGIGALMRQYMSTAALIVLLSLAVSAVLASALPRRVSAPVLAIADVARRVAETRCYSDRVQIDSRDELGVLARSFNLMLEEIERRDGALALQQSRLEEQVEERNRVNEQLVQAKEAAEEAANVKAEFLANMSHEIRTPMNGVIGMLRLALDQPSSSEQREHLDLAHQAAQSLVALVDDVLDISRIDAGRMTIESIPFNLRALLRDSFRLFDLAIRNKGLKGTVSIDPDCPRWVMGDPLRMRQVLTNLLGNAVKFTSRGGIDLAVESSPGGVCIEVRDTGIGVPANKLDAIFDAFTQADGSTTRKFGGSGLGLAISRSIVQLMGGRLSAESLPSVGSRFFVELPMAACAPPSEKLSATPDLKKLGALRILVAEDNPINQKVIQAILRKQDWVVAVAANGRETVDRFLGEPFDLILMDVQMPEMDGLAATRLIRQEEASRRLPRTPILALTAHVLPAQHRQCLAAGMDGVVTKPVSLANLADAIADLILAPAGDSPPPGAFTGRTPDSTSVAVPAAAASNTPVPVAESAR